MIPRVLIDTAKIPGGGELRLFERIHKNGSEFSIMLGSNELMNSRMSGSEEALATLAHEAISTRKNPRILIGGLGMGFTLRAAMAAFGSDAKVMVSELVPEVMQWARGSMAELFGDCLENNQVTLKITDVYELMEQADQSFDAILLDTDNGPDGITLSANDRLYSEAGLGKALGALQAGGVLAIWSSKSDQKFARRLQNSGFQVEEHRVRARSSGKGAHHIIWLAKKR